MMSTKLEECARALAPKAWATYGIIGKDTLANQHRRKASIKHASAVIRCLMEQPDGKLSDAMTVAAFRASCKENGGIEMAIFPMFRNMLQSVLDEGK